MKREDFLYQYLLKYNQYEQDFNGEDAVKYWKKYDKAYGKSGLVFMVLRNALVHNTLETIGNLEKIRPLSEIIKSLEDCILEGRERIEYMNIFFENNKILSDFKNKGFKLINTNRNNLFKLLQKNNEGIYSTIFFSHSDLLFNASISTYNHHKGICEYYKGYYVESEIDENYYIIKICKHDFSIIKHHLVLHLDKNFNLNKLYHSISFINICIIAHDSSFNKEITLNSHKIEELKSNGLRDLFNTYSCDSTVREIAEIVKKSFNDINNILHIIGI